MSPNLGLSDLQRQGVIGREGAALTGGGASASSVWRSTARRVMQKKTTGVAGAARCLIRR
jgi:hypothetical protein